MRPEDAHYRIIRLIEQRPEITQRELAMELGVSLGKVNYCLRALIEKGHIKLRNFRSHPDKRHYRYLLTAKGVESKAAQTVQFLRRKFEEYEKLTREIEALSAELHTSSLLAGEGAPKGRVRAAPQARNGSRRIDKQA